MSDPTGTNLTAREASLISRSVGADRKYQIGERVRNLRSDVDLRSVVTNVGVGDQIALTTTDPTAFTEKTSVGVSGNAADDFLNVDWSVFVDSVNATPQFTIEVLVGSTVIDTAVIATAAANDYAAGHARLKLTAVGASLTAEVTTDHKIKDGTLAYAGAIQTALAITASSIAGYDITVRVTSNAGHADNKCTLRTISHSIERKSS